MKKLFIQFYLLLFVCFLVMSLLVGLVYKFTAERAGKQSLDDLMNSSLYLMRSELREIPPHDWGKTLKEMDLNLSFDLRVEPLSKYHLDDISMHRLRGGEIVALDDQYTFLQRIPRSHYVLAVGPVPYLYYLHQHHNHSQNYNHTANQTTYNTVQCQYSYTSCNSEIFWYENHTHFSDPIRTADQYPIQEKIKSSCHARTFLKFF